jgi:tetratricopeptide (TPR) repeat protein
MTDYDIFFSHAWADGARPQEIRDALVSAGLRVWFDANEIKDFESITNAVTAGLAKSKVLLAYYSKTYPLRRACQWELTAAFLAAQREGDPRRRVLILNPEDGTGHIHPIELRDAKFRDPRTNDEASVQELVHAIVSHVAGLNGSLADIQPLAAPSWYGMTPVGSTRFVGRLKEMWEIHSLLHAGDVAQITGAAAASGGIGQLHGLGGVGKSLVTEEYALHFGTAYPGGVFWLRAYGNDDSKPILGAEEREALRISQFQEIAEQLATYSHGLTPNQVQSAIREKLEQRGKSCLWVVDDIPNGLDGEALRRWFAPHAVARTLITTRSREYSSLAKALDLAVLMREEAYQLLTSRCHPITDKEEEQAHLLAEDLGRHALALDVTASALMSYGDAERYSRFRVELNQSGQDSLELAKNLADALPNGHEASIAKTMLRSIRALGEEGRDFLRFASLLAVAPISADLLTAVFEKASGIERDKAVWRQRKAFHDVTNASLAEIAGANQGARTIHTLVSRVVRFENEANSLEREKLQGAIVAALEVEIAKEIPDARRHAKLEFHIAHARQIVIIPKNFEEAELVSSVAHYDATRGAFQSAVKLQGRVVDFHRQTLGPEHLTTLRATNSLATFLHRAGDRAGAEKLHRETRDILYRVRGPDDPDTLAATSNLAGLLSEADDFAEARKLHEEVLAVRLRLLGPEHLQTITSMHNLGVILQVQGELNEALRLIQTAAKIRERELGAEHPDTLTAMNNLGSTLELLGDLPAGRRIKEETLEIRSRVLGPENPQTLTSMQNLSASMLAAGDLSGARQLQEELLILRRRVLGPCHPITLTTVDILFRTLQRLALFEEAKKLKEETLAVCRPLLGTGHPRIPALMQDVAAGHLNNKEFESALNLLSETIEISYRVKGPEHPDTLVAMNNLAVALSSQGNFLRARQLHEKTLDIQRRVLGTDHPNTLSTMSNLYAVLSDLNATSAARILLEEILAIKTRLLGEENLETLYLMNDVAIARSNEGDMPGARKLQMKQLEIFTRVMGLEHPHTSTSAWNLVTTHHRMNDLEAERDVIDRNLLWLLSRDPKTLPPEQIKIREIIGFLRGQGENAI